MRNYIFIFFFAFFPAKLWGFCESSTFLALPNPYRPISVSTCFLVEYEICFDYFDKASFYLEDTLGNEIKLDVKDKIEGRLKQLLLQPAQSLQPLTFYSLKIKGNLENWNKQELPYERFQEYYLERYTWQTDSLVEKKTTQKVIDCLMYADAITQFYLLLQNHPEDIKKTINNDSIFNKIKQERTEAYQLLAYIHGEGFNLSYKFAEKSEFKPCFLKVKLGEISFYYYIDNTNDIMIGKERCVTTPFDFGTEEKTYSFHLTLLSETGEVFDERDKIVEWR